MDKASEWEELKDTLRIFTIWAVTSLIDGLFVALWGSVQYLVNLVIKVLELNGIDRFVFYVFQILFATSTLAPVTLYIYRDLRVKILRTQRRIRAEMEVSDNHGANR